MTDREGSLALEALELYLHEGMRALEEAWQLEDDGRTPPAQSWNQERDRLRRETRQVVLFALVIGAVTAEEVAAIAQSLQGQGLSDPLGNELQQPGIEDLANEFRAKLIGNSP
ncbi:MAG: hypothetical protein DCC49_00045 [Acidobacteria bacterium]|nr:MAG: hypothetical protein DCC49_00045 [Acidobacteriota bacterium]